MNKSDTFWLLMVASSILLTAISTAIVTRHIVIGQAKLHDCIHEIETADGRTITLWRGQAYLEGNHIWRFNQDATIEHGSVEDLKLTPANK